MLEALCDGDERTAADVVARLHGQGEPVVEVPGRDVPADARHTFVAGVAPDLVVITLTSSDTADAAEAIAAELTAGGHDVLVGEPGRTLADLVHVARTVRAARRRLLTERQDPQ